MLFEDIATLNHVISNMRVQGPDTSSSAAAASAVPGAGPGAGELLVPSAADPASAAASVSMPASEMAAPPPLPFRLAPFHDVHDPEIDRLFNSSPKPEDLLSAYEFHEAASVLRIDPDADAANAPTGDDVVNTGAEPPTPPPAAKPSAPTTATKADTATGAAVAAAKAKSPTMAPKASVHAELDFRPVSVEPRPRTTTMRRRPSGDEGGGGDGDVHASANGDVEADMGLLSELSKKLSAGGAEDDEDEGDTVLTVYLPTREPMELRVDEEMKVDDLISKILRVHAKRELTPELLDNNSAYEIRLHEGDGEPDEDFPALDRVRPLRYFGDVNEYCLCALPGFSDPANGGGASPGAAGAATAGGQQQPAIMTDVITITTPTSSAKFHLRDSTTGRELLLKMATKHRLRMFTVEYEFHVSREDQARLNMLSTALDMDADITPLGISELELRKKTFADAPRVAVAENRGRGDELAGEARPDPDTFMFTDVTAAVYQEWMVVKKNKYGRRQPRVMGVDSQKIYNRKRETAGKKSGDVYRADRDINSIRKIEYVEDNARAFRIVYDDDGEFYTVEYTADTAKDCAEIVAKINYIKRYLRS